MGLFDIFKKKTQSSQNEHIDTENILEKNLRRAAAEPAFRTEFYKSLLSENLIVLTDKARLPEGTQILQEDTNVNFSVLDDGRIPVFTSTSKIFDKGIIKEQVPFLQMKGEDLFNVARGATFILNAYSDYGKELLPDEIEGLLKGTIFTGNHKSIEVQRDTQVQLGQPKNYPTEIVRSLKILFANRPTVKAAYLGWIYNPSTGERPHLIFALDIEGEKQAITKEAGFTAQQLSAPGDIIDFIQIDKETGLGNYFLKETKAFYMR